MNFTCLGSNTVWRVIFRVRIHQVPTDSWYIVKKQRVVLTPSRETIVLLLIQSDYVVFFVDLWFEVKMGLEFAVLRQHHHGVVGVSSERDPVKVLWTLLIRFHALVRVKSSLLLAPSP